MVRNQTLHRTMQDARSQATGTAKGLEVLLDTHGAVDEPWEEKRNEAWLERYWKGVELNGDHELYAAVVDETGKIVMHTDSSKIGQWLGRGWYERRVSEAGPDVVWSPTSALAPDRAAYDVVLPMNVGDRQVGEYHKGIDAKWMESTIASEQRRVRARWLWVIGLVGAVDAAAVGALIFLARRQSRVWRRLRGESRDRTREIAQIGAGLAHEVRNPLHALRINLHTLRRAFGGRATLPEEQLVATVEESNAAIDRLDNLMRDFLLFSDPGVGNVDEVDVVHEVRATLNLQAENLRHDQIEVRTELTAEPTPIDIDPIRLRQLLHNLLTYAQHRAGKTGKIDVSVAHKDGGVEIAIEDSGPGLPELQRARIFEPFQAQAETGSGLGLALVQVHVEEAGGRASFGCNGSANGCRVWFPLASTANNGGES